MLCGNVSEYFSLKCLILLYKENSLVISWSKEHAIINYILLKNILRVLSWFLFSSVNNWNKYCDMTFGTEIIHLAKLQVQVFNNFMHFGAAK